MWFLWHQQGLQINLQAGFDVWCEHKEKKKGNINSNNDVRAFSSPGKFVPLFWLTL